MLLYDRNNFYAGNELDFENVFGKTGEDGVVNLGKLPSDYFCVQAGGYYTVIGQQNLEYKQTKPAAEFLTLEQTPEQLVVTFNMAPRVDYKFEILDKQTGKQIDFPEIFVQDDSEDWWTLLVIDGQDSIRCVS